MASYTKLLQFDTATKKKIYQRDGGCIFCQMNYNMHPKFPNVIDCLILDPMHFIPKSKMGLGIEENGVCGCRWHHSLLDNGNKGLRPEMLEIMEAHLKSIYPGWNKKNLTYRKWSYLE